MAEDAAIFDMVIIGGGPAGLSAALWCGDLGLRSVVLERSFEPGGQLLHTYNQIKNYPGIPSIAARELRDRFAGGLADSLIITNADVDSTDLSRGVTTLSDGRQYRGRSILIATGVRRRELGIPGERYFWGRGVIDSGVKRRDALAGKLIAIVGGGDAAIENALVLSETAEQVIVVHRTDRFTARPEFLDAARRRTNIKFMPGTRVTTIQGGTEVEYIGIETADGRRDVEVDAVLIRIGVMPNTEAFQGQIELDDKGYIVIDASCRTTLDRVYAAGDAANPTAPTIAAAIGQASIAVKSAIGQLKGT